MEYITLAAGMILMPCLYSGALLLCRPSFKEDKNKKSPPFGTAAEYAVMLSSELAFIRIWLALGKCSLGDLRFQLLYVMLTAMAVLCVTDLKERIVPNRLLLVLIFLFIILFGRQSILDMDEALGMLPSIVLGLLFCMISFGMGYLLSHGSMGAGDIKLSLVMGLYLTGEYVVGAVLYGCIAGAVFSIVQLCRKKLTRKDTIPFVPFLFIGVIIRYLIG